VATSILLITASAVSMAAAKASANRPYVAVMADQGPFYARCIPYEKRGSAGITQVMRVRGEGDEVVVTHPWYNRHGLVMAWSPRVGKVALMRVRQDTGLLAEKQVEFSFYLGDRLLRSYTTADLARLGANVVVDRRALEDGHGLSARRAEYRVEGCKQVRCTNDYYFSVRLDATRALSFDIMTGKLCRIEKNGARERLVPVETDAVIGRNDG
jgi:hypothetical protein